LADVIYDGPIIPFGDEVLPASLPFAPETTSVTSELADLGPTWRIKVEIELTQTQANPVFCPDPNGCVVRHLLGGSTLPQLVGKRITLSFVPWGDDARRAFRKYGGYHADEFTASDGFQGTLLEHCVQHPYHDECEVFPSVQFDGQLGSAGRRGSLGCSERRPDANR
jgi:hypothetical protein